MRQIKYYNVAEDYENDSADIFIFGDIVEPTTKAFFGIDADVSGYSLVREIENLNVGNINVHINSYGGHVSEGFAIYNSLRSHKANVRTIVEGFACSAASVVFMAGDERIMRELSALFIHEVQSSVSGSADAKRKAADEDEALSRTSANAYLAHVTIPEEQLLEMMRVETWIQPQDAVSMGFATTIEREANASKAAQSARGAVMSRVFAGSNWPAKEVKSEVMLTMDNLKKVVQEALDSMLSQAKPSAEPEPPAQTKKFFNWKGK